MFIATLFGLVLAMITLAGEVMYYKKQNKKVLRKNKKTKSTKINPNNKEEGAATITLSSTFKPIELPYKYNIKALPDIKKSKRILPMIK